MRSIHDVATPALVVDAVGFAHNLETMRAARPGPALRPHVKAFKSTATARMLADAGHRSFCCATIREVEGMAAAGLGEDLLLANEVLDARRLGAVTAQGARVTVAVDSAETIAAAAAGGVREVLIDVNVGLPRCGCDPDAAGALADTARAAGLVVRGVMGYEGHVMDWPDRSRQADAVAEAMALLRLAHGHVGGGLVSAGGTGTFDLHTWADEVQAGSYLFMDTHYARVGLPFVEALSVHATVVSIDHRRRWAVVDAGLKAFGMDHGNPAADPTDGEVFFCSDEHTTLLPGDLGGHWRIGDRVRLRPAHVDPTISQHERLLVTDPDGIIVDDWPVDLRGW